MGESCWVRLLGFVEHGLTLREDLRLAAGVQVGGVQVPDGAVVVLMVVPGEEVPAPRAGGLEAVEPVGVVGVVLQRLEMRFAVGIGVHRRLHLFATLKRERCG